MRAAHDRISRAQIAAIGALAALLCLWPVSWPLWPDEVFTAGVLSRDAAGIVESAAKDRHPPLYYLLASLQPADPASGSSDAWIRLPSALAALASVALLLALSAHTREADPSPDPAPNPSLDPAPDPDEPARLRWTALLLAASPVTALFAHTARMYALVGLCGAGLLAGIVLLRRGREAAGLLALAVASVAALYTHYASAGAVLGAWLCALAGSRSPRQILIRAAAGAAAAACFLPWLPTLQAQLADRDSPAARSWEALRYLGWAGEDGGSWWAAPVALLQLAGAIALIRRDRAWIAWFGAAILFPLWASSSAPALAARNWIGLMPLWMYAAAEALLRLSRVLPAQIPALSPALSPAVGPALSYTVALMPLITAAQILLSAASPQDLGHGRDYRLEAAAMAESLPPGASLRFEPAYAARQYSRYAPSLEAANAGKAAPAEVWWARLSGAKPPAGGCAYAQAFRAALVIPSAEGCARAEEIVGRAAEETGYGFFLVEIGRRALERDPEEALSYARRAAPSLPRHPAALDLAADALAARQQWAEAADAACGAAEIARSNALPDRMIAGMWEQCARMLSRAAPGSDDLAHAQAAAACARARQPARACGGWLSWATLPIEASPAPEDKDDPKRDGAPASGQGDPGGAPVNPSASPANAAGDPLSLPQRWEFDGWPDGWIRTGEAGVEGGRLWVGDGKGKIDVTCTPIVAAGAGMVAAWSRSADILSLDPPTWSVLEIREVDAAGKPVGSAEPARLFATRKATGFEEERGEWRPAAEPGAATGGAGTLARACVKTGGAGAGRTLVDWLELRPIGE